MPTYKDPWADAANQAVGALYKHYLTKPSEADMEAARLETATNQAKLRQLQMGNQMDQRLYDMGGWSGAPAPVQNHLYRQGLEGSDAAQLFDAYVNKPMQVDTGDTKYIVSGNTGLPMQQYGVGTPPKTEIDTKGGRVISALGVPSPNRPPMPGQISPELLNSMARVESNFDPNAVSPKGAAGLMQIMPDTARDPGYGVQPLQGWDGVDPRTAPIEEQIRFASDYANAMKQEFGSDELAVAAYNAGPGAVQQHGGIPPYQETQNYVRNVMGGVPSGGTTVTPLPKSPVVAEKEAETDRLRNIQGDLVNSEIMRSLDDLDGSWPVAGHMGSMLSKVPFIGQAGTDFAEKLDTIKANIGFDKLQAMRAASPTGGALGQVSEFENRLLQAVYGSLSQSQSEEQLRYNLIRLYNTYNDIIHKGVNEDGSFKIPDAQAPQMELPMIDGFSNEDIDFTAQKYGISREQVIERLRGQ